MPRWIWLGIPAAVLALMGCGGPPDSTEHITPGPAPTQTVLPAVSGEVLTEQLQMMGCELLGEASRYSQDAGRDITTQQWVCDTADVMLTDAHPAQPGELVIGTVSPTVEVNFWCEPRSGARSLQEAIDVTLTMYNAVMGGASTDPLGPPYPPGTSSISSPENGFVCYSRM